MATGVDAADRAWLAYALYIGHHRLGRAADIKAVQPERLDRLVDPLTSPPG